jgi:tetratricopeptide (TPR) repeat protein
MAGAVFFWFIFSIIIGAIGEKRKIGFAGGFFLSLLLSPLIGLIIVLVSEKKEVNTGQQRPVNKSINTSNDDDLYTKALQKSNEGSYQEAIDLFHESLQNNGQSANAHFNLACCYSELNKTDFAFKHLSKSIELGYSNFEKIETDPSLENVRNTEKFAEFAEQGYKLT